MAAKEYVVKAQIHAGGRGKGYFVENNFKGGVHLTTDPKVAGTLTERMLGNHLVTQQTPPSGVPVREVMIAESLTFDKEYYFAILMDRASQGPVVVASTEGGMDIEKVAEKTPERIFSEKVDITKGLLKEQALKLASQLGFKAGSTRDEASEQMMRLYQLFIDLDATQVLLRLVDATRWRSTLSCPPPKAGSTVLMPKSILTIMPRSGNPTSGS